MYDYPYYTWSGWGLFYLLIEWFGITPNATTYIVNKLYILPKFHTCMFDARKVFETVNSTSTGKKC